MGDSKLHTWTFSFFPDAQPLGSIGIDDLESGTTSRMSAEGLVPLEGSIEPGVPIWIPGPGILHFCCTLYNEFPLAGPHKISGVPPARSPEISWPAFCVQVPDLRRKPVT